MKKVFKIVLITIGILLVLAVSLPFIFKGKIVSAIKDSANKNLNAKLDFGDFDLSLIRSFPNFSIRIDNLSIINVKPFEGDTLYYAKKTDLTLDIMSVISGSEIKIKSVNLTEPVMKFLVSADGKANWDITKPSTDAQSGETKFKASLSKYSIDKGRVFYDDRTMPFTLSLNGVNHTGKGDFTQDLFVLSTHTEADAMTMNYGGIDYFSKVRAVADADVDMDIKNFKFTFKDNHFSLNDLPVAFSGWLAMPANDIDMDLKFDVSKAEFKNFLSLVPGVYSKDFSNVKASGKLAFNGYIKGRYNDKSMPGFGINLNIDNGQFKYPDLPSDVKNVFVDLKVVNADGVPDHTIVDLKKMHVEMASTPFDAKLLLKTPVSDPDIDASLKGVLNLTTIQKIVPLEKGMQLSGIINADVTAKGRMSAIEQKRYEDFYASGNFKVTDLNYKADGSPATLIRNMELALNPSSVKLNVFNAIVGKSDFNATGSLENFIPYALSNQTLRGDLKLISNVIDVNEFMTGGTDKKDTATSSAGGAVQVPANLNLTFSASIGKLLYDNLTIQNVRGAIVVKDAAIKMQDVGMELLDGKLLMNGSYSAANIKAPVYSFDMKVSDFDIQKTAAAFNTVEKLAPIAKHCTGKVSSTLMVNGLMNAAMEPQLSSINGYGKLTTSKITLQNFGTTDKIADALKMNQFKKLDIPSANPSFKISNGKVIVDPFDVSLNNIKATVAGSTSLDQTIDYTMGMNVPRDMFGGAANNVLNGLVSKANSSGANFSVGDVIPIAIGIGGTVLNPVIKTDINKKGAALMNDLKAKAQEEFDKKKAEVEAKAKAEADRIKKEAEAKVKSESDRIKKEAEAKAKAEAEKAKKEAEKKAKEELDKINPFKKK